MTELKDSLPFTQVRNIGTINKMHNLSFYVFTFRFNIILPSTLRSNKQVLLPPFISVKGTASIRFVPNKCHTSWTCHEPRFNNS